MNGPGDIRKRVSEDYARAVSKPGQGCCGSSTKGAAAAFAGYSAEELTALPEDAVTNSFGCGNPLAMAAVRQGDTVLDLGSGAGIDLFLAALKTGPEGRVIGIDMTDEMVARARENIDRTSFTNIEVRKGLIEDMPVESGSVDLVVSNCVINLSPEKERVFSEIARVLKPGGTMTVSDLVAEDLPPEVRTDRRLYSSCLAGAISEADYMEGLRKAGLEDVRVIDRIVYDRAQLEALVSSETGCSCCCTSEGSGSAMDWAARLAGRIASIRFSARRPSA
jgi:SAM-dependent methyltransferase